MGANSSSLPCGASTRRSLLAGEGEVPVRNRLAGIDDIVDTTRELNSNVAVVRDDENRLGFRVPRSLRLVRRRREEEVAAALKEQRESAVGEGVRARAEPLHPDQRTAAAVLRTLLHSAAVRERVDVQVLLAEDRRGATDR